MMFPSKKEPKLYTRFYEVTTEAYSEAEAIQNFEDDGPECGPACSEAVPIDPAELPAEFIKEARAI